MNTLYLLMAICTFLIVGCHSVQPVPALLYFPDIPSEYSITYDVLFPNVPHQHKQKHHQSPRNNWRTKNNNLQINNGDGENNLDNYFALGWILVGLVIILGFGGEIRKSATKRDIE